MTEWTNSSTQYAKITEAVTTYNRQMRSERRKMERGKTWQAQPLQP